MSFITELYKLVAPGKADELSDLIGKYCLEYSCKKLIPDGEVLASNLTADQTIRFLRNGMISDATEAVLKKVDESMVLEKIGPATQLSLRFIVIRGGFNG